MAFPWTFEESFDDGTKGDFGTESDTGSLLDFPHYTTLAAIPGMEVPFRGAYCMRIICGDANDHTLLEEDLNIAAAGTESVRFYMFIDKNFAATSDDIFNIFEWQSTSNVVEAVISLQITAATDVVEITIADGTEGSTNFNEITKGVWHCIEATVLAATDSTGTLDLFVDGGIYQAQQASVDFSLAITHGLLGTQNTLSTTTGTILFDQFVFDDGRIFPFQRRFVENVLVTKDQHLFVGNGMIENVTLMSRAGTDSVITIYDTDDANTNDASNIVAELKNTANNEVVDPAGMPVRVTRGAYIVMTGADTRALVKIGAAQGWGSAGAIRNYASRRSA